MTSEDMLTIHSSWPASTLTGEPGIVTGLLTVSGYTDGSRGLNLVIGENGAPPEECDFVEFVLSVEHAQALARVLS